MSNNSENFDDMPYDSSVDDETPRNTPFCPKYKRNFGYATLRDRLPIILTNIVDHLSRDKEKIANDYGKDAVEESKTAIGEISKLKNELQTNKTITPFDFDAPDVPIWNTYLQHETEIEGSTPRWYDSPWLYVECYMYRRLRLIFEMTSHLKTFDPFRQKKDAALFNSMDTINVLAKYFNNIVETITCSDVKHEFRNLLYVNLWGNRCDLSLSAGQDIVMQEDPLEKIVELKKYLLTDRSSEIWDVLAAKQGNSDVTVDIVLDNAGYELYTDFCLADFILTFSLATKVRFRVKEMPWYVSDTMIPDIHGTLQILAKSENSCVATLADRWSGYIDSGKLTLHADSFWTFPHDFSQMKVIDPKLYDDLAKALIVIFKGDLNYRKLIGDLNWDTTKSFSGALRGFQPTNVAALRTLKSDGICDLVCGQAASVEAESPDWRVSGEYGIIQFSPL